MKKLITAARSKYKPDDLRTPLIRAIEDVLNILFTGATSDWQYSPAYDCYFRYKIVSGKSIGPNTYKLTLWQEDADENGERVWGEFYPDKTILEDMERYILDNYSDLDTRVNARYGFLLCDSYIQNGMDSRQLRDMAWQVYKLLYANKYIDDMDPSYKSYNGYVQIQFDAYHWSDEGVEQYKEDVASILESNGYDVKSVAYKGGYGLGYGSPSYNPRLIINLFI